MDRSGGASVRVLAVRAGARLLAVPISSLAEIMRPLAMTALTGVPAFILGASIIRGCLAPVVDMAALLGAADPAPGRLVALRLGSRRVALAVHSVLGVRTLDVETLQPLFAQAVAGAVEGLGRLDSELVHVLGATRIVPEAVWPAVES